MKLNPVEKAMIQEMYADHKEMKVALLGNPSMHVDGVVQRLKKVERKSSNHEKALWIFSGFLLAVEAVKKYFGHG